MIFSPRIGLKPLAGLSRRLSTSLEAGLDARKVWQREAERARGTMRAKFQQVSLHVAAGESTADALAKTGKYFPETFRELSNVGEHAGRLSEVYRQLAEHYEHQVELRRTFLAAIAWPMTQLTMAVFIVGVLIFVLGLLPTAANGKPIDILGFGLIGTRGLVIYLTWVGGIVLTVALVIQILRRGGPWSGMLRRIVWRVPVLGKAIRTLALSRFTWSLYVTTEAGMELRKALALSLQSTQAPDLIRHTDEVLADIRSGREVTETLRATGEFPTDILDAIEVGEQSGQLPESLALLSRQQEESARSSLKVLTGLAGFGVWCLVAMLIIAVIFRVFSMYMSAIDQALKG